jgi:hypothetical protein
MQNAVTRHIGIPNQHTLATRQNINKPVVLLRPFNLLLSHLFGPRFAPEPFGLAINNLSNNNKCTTGKNRNDWHKSAHKQERLLLLAMCHFGNRGGLSICAIARPGREKSVVPGSLWGRVMLNMSFTAFGRCALHA